MARKYKRGKRIDSVGEFEQSKSLWFMVRYGVEQKTTHRGFLISWQYHLLERFIKAGRLYEAELRDDIETHRAPGFIGIRKDGEDGKAHRSALQCEGDL